MVCIYDTVDTIVSAFWFCVLVFLLFNNTLFKKMAGLSEKAYGGQVIFCRVSHKKQTNKKQNMA